MKKFILTLIIAMLFLIPFASTIGELTDANSEVVVPYELNEITTSTFDVIDNLIDIDINGSEIDNDLISLIPSTPSYTDTLTMMINGTLEGVADSYNRLQNAASMPTGTLYKSTFSPDGTKLVVGFNQAPFIRIYDITTDPMTSYTTLDSYVSQPYRDFAYSPDGSRLAIGIGASVAGSPYMTVYRTDTTPYTRLTDPASPSGLVLSLEYSPDGNHLAVGHGTSPFLTIYDTTTDPYTKISSPSTLPTATVASLKYSHDGRYLAVGMVGASPYVLLYDTSTTPYTNISGALDPAYTVTPLEMRFSKDDSLFVVGGQSVLSIYDTSTTPFFRINTLAVDTGYMDLNHDDSILTTKYASSGVRIYDMNNLFNLLSLLDTTYTTGVSHIEYSPDGSRLAVIYSSATPSFSLYNTNIKYFDILDQEGNVLHSLDFETTYTNEMVNIAVVDLTGISFRSQGMDLTTPSSLSIDVELSDAIIENPSPMAGVIRFVPLLGFIAVATIFIAFILSRKR